MEKVELVRTPERLPQANETVVETLAPWSKITKEKPGTYFVAYFVVDKDLTHGVFASVGVVSNEKGDGRRIDGDVKVTPDLGVAFNIEYRLKATSKVTCQALDPLKWKDPPVWSSDPEEKKQGRLHRCPWDTAKQNPKLEPREYLVQVIAAPLDPKDADEADRRVKFVTVKDK